GACADAADGHVTATATPTAATSGWCMVPPGATAVFCQHRLCWLRAASLPSDCRAQSRQSKLRASRSANDPKSDIVVRVGSERRSVSTLNDVRWIWPSRAARADIVACCYGLAVIFLELAQRRDRNVAQLAMVIGVLGYGTPCHRKTSVRSAAVRCRDQLCRGLRSLVGQPDQFGTTPLSA